MKLRDLIANIDRSDKNRSQINVESFLNELGLNFGYQWKDLENYGFTSYYMAAWYCTDSFVGCSVIFYDQMLDKTVILDSTLEMVKVIQTYRDFDQIKKWGTVGIQGVNGKQTVKMDEITVPWRIK